MRSFVSALACALAAVACGGSETDAAGPDGPTGGAAPTATTPATDFDGADVVTPAQAAAEAERSITPDNADEELEKLSKEIEGDG